MEEIKNSTQLVYRIVREWKRNSRIVDVMETSSFASEEAAMLWFSKYIHTMLTTETSGNYRQEIYTQVGDGLWLSECSGLVEDELPEWWQGCGIYDESENLVFGYDYEKDCPVDIISQFDDGNYIYRIEEVEAPDQDMFTCERCNQPSQADQSFTVSIDPDDGHSDTIEICLDCYTEICRGEQ